MASKKRMREAILEKTGGYSRVWLVLFRTWEIGSGDSVREYFDRNYSLADERAFPGLEVFLYDQGKAFQRELLNRGRI
jgi:hypothetical protein